MSKDLNESQIGRVRKERNDIGGRHRSKKYKDMVLRQYLLSGEFVREWRSIEDAVDAGGGKLSYGGIYNAIKGKQFQHGGYLWRSDKGAGRGLLDGEVDVDAVWRNAVEWMKGIGSGMRAVRIEAVDMDGEVRTYEQGYGSDAAPDLEI